MARFSSALLSLAVITAFGAGAAHADNNGRAFGRILRESKVEVRQTGTANGAAIAQKGAANAAGVSQVGNLNAGTITQTGAVNTATLRQYGNANTGSIEQVGTGNTGCLVQLGNGLSGSISQEGTGQSVGVVQLKGDSFRIAPEACEVDAKQRGYWIRMAPKAK